MSKLADKCGRLFKKREKTKEEIIFDLIQNLYLKSSNTKINKLAKKISIVNIVNKDIEFVSVEGYYETRKIFNTRKPSSKIEVSPGQKSKADAYDKWNFNLDAYEKEFKKQDKTYTLRDSMYLENCTKCGTLGAYECKDCLTGYFDCKDCNATGYVYCGACDGRGGTSCGYCGGSGYVEDYVYEYDSHGNEHRRRVYNSCYQCNGGKAPCIMCGATGKILCDTCGGKSHLECKTCHGSKRAICSACTGKGYYLNQVEIEQNYTSERINTFIKPYDFDPDRYVGQKFDSLRGTEKDICTYEMVSDKAITETRHKNITSTNKSLEETISKKGGRRVLKYRAREFKREVVEVEYTIKGKTFFSMIDLATGQILVDKTPYEVFKIKLNDKKEEKIRAKKAKKAANKKAKKTKRSKRLGSIDMDIIVTWAIGLIIIGGINVPYIIKLIGEQGWIRLGFCVVTLLVPIKKLYDMYDDLYPTWLKLFLYIKMIIVILVVTTLAHMSNLLIYEIATRNVR